MHVSNHKCIRRLSFRALKAAKKRNIIAIIAIALTTLLFTSLFTVMMSVNASYETYTFRQIGGYSHGTFKDVTDEQIKALQAHPDIKKAAPALSSVQNQMTVSKNAAQRSAIWIQTQQSGATPHQPPDVSHKRDTKSQWTQAH